MEKCHQTEEKATGGYMYAIFPFTIKNAKQLCVHLEEEAGFAEAAIKNSPFFLKYTNRLFQGETVSPLRAVYKKEVQWETKLRKKEDGVKKEKRREEEVQILEAQVYTFATGIGFLAIKIKPKSRQLCAWAFVAMALRMCNSYQPESDKFSSLYMYAAYLLHGDGKETVSLFDHIEQQENGGRCQVFSAFSMEQDEDIEKSAKYLAHCFELRENTFDTETCYEKLKPFSYIEWCFTKQGVAGVARYTGNNENDAFIGGWADRAEATYLPIYILALHQKYAVYHFLNEIDAASHHAGTLTKYQKKLIDFNTKYRFNTLSDETLHQIFYCKTKEVLDIDQIFHDVDEEVSRISQQALLDREEHFSRISVAISFICIFSTLIDLFGLFDEGNIWHRFCMFSSLKQAVFVTICVFVIILCVFLPGLKMRKNRRKRK